MNTDKTIDTLDIQQVKQFLSQLSPRQMAELAEELRNDWRLPQTPVVDPRPPDPPEPVVNPDRDVVVTDVGASRVAVIRALRAARPELDLRTARDLLKALPAVVGSGLAVEAGESLAGPLRDAGATVELRPAS